MEQRYLADTNAIIDYLEDKLPDNSAKLLDSSVRLSVVSRIELLAWSKATREQIILLNKFISASEVFNLDEEIIQQTIQIRKLYKINSRTRLLLLQHWRMILIC